MGFAQWFWRLFLVFAGLIVAHVLAVTLIVVWSQEGSEGRGFPYGEVWLAAALVLMAGMAATWICVRQIVAPLSELTRSVRAASTTDSGPHLVATRDEVGVLTGAFDQMQRDLARRLAQIEQNNQRLEAVLSSMAEGVLAIGPDRTI